MLCCICPKFLNYKHKVTRTSTWSVSIWGFAKFQLNCTERPSHDRWVKGISFYRNCAAASVGEWYTKIWFTGINRVDNVNWPPYRDWKADEGLTLETTAFQSLYGGQFTLSTPLINQIFFSRQSLMWKVKIPWNLDNLKSLHNFVCYYCSALWK